MLSTKLKFISFAVVLFAAAAILFVYPGLKSGASGLENDLSPQAINPYGQMANVLSKCNMVNRVTEPTIKAPFSPAASLCINGSLAAGDPDYSRPDINSTGTGIGTCPGAVPANYDVYSFNLSGCAAFPTLVRATLCGPAGCLNLGNFDSRMYLYRQVAAGDALSANGGLPGVFNAASPCTNVQAGNNELNGGASNTAPNGNSCSQTALPPQTCEGACAGNNNLSGFHRKLGSGRFTIVISGTNTADVGNYNLFVDAASAGCTVALAPTSANANISGRVVTSVGQGIPKVNVTITGSEIAPMTLRTSPFGYYNFKDLPSGTYFVTVSAKGYTFANPTQTVNLDENVSDVNFVSEQ